MGRDPMGYLAESARKWFPLLAGIGAVAGAGFGIHYEAQAKLREIRKELDAVTRSLTENFSADRDFRALGPGGFTHPAIRMGVDEQIRVYMDAHGCRCKEYWRSFFQLNPTLVRPTDE